MDHPKDCVAESQEHLKLKLKQSIDVLKQASHSWNLQFNEVIKYYGFDENVDEACVYNKLNGKIMVFLVLCVNDILLIGNDVGVLSIAKI